MWEEPFASLDSFTREELWCVLRDLWQRIGFTVILVTHDLHEATFLADTIHVMCARPGRIVLSRLVDLPRPRDDMFDGESGGFSSVGDPSGRLTRIGGRALHEVSP